MVTELHDEMQHEFRQARSGHSRSQKCAAVSLASESFEDALLKVHLTVGPKERNKELGTIVLKIKQIRRTGFTHEPNAPQTLPGLVKGKYDPSMLASVG